MFLLPLIAHASRTDDVPVGFVARVEAQLDPVEIETQFQATLDRYASALIRLAAGPPLARSLTGDLEKLCMQIDRDEWLFRQWMRENLRASASLANQVSLLVDRIPRPSNIRGPFPSSLYAARLALFGEDHLAETLARLNRQWEMLQVSVPEESALDAHPETVDLLEEVIQAKARIDDLLALPAFLE